MSSACTPILVGVVSPVSEILLPSITANYGDPWNSPWSSKNLIDRNWLKKFMQVEIDVTYMHTSFGGRDSPVSEIWLPFKNGQISLSTHGL